MPDIRLWQHKTSGEVYAVRYVFDNDGYVYVLQAVGALHYSEFETALDGFDDDPE